MRTEAAEQERLVRKEKSNLGFHVLKFSEADNLDDSVIGDSRLLQDKNETDQVKLEEAGIRKKAIVMLQVVLWVTLAADLICFSIRYISGSLAQEAIFPYFLKRILFQFLVNFVIYAAALYATEYRKYKFSVKNGIVAVAVCTMAGSIGVFHSHSPAFWIASGIGLMFSSVFRDRKLLRNCFLYCVVLTAMAALFALGESAGEGAAIIECFRNLAVSELLILVIYLVSRTMLIHQTEIMNMTENFYRMQKEYRQQSEVDNLTRVYSRYYFVAEGNELLNVCSSSNPVSVCMLDIDDFKKVNDTYGHDNGDVVLRQLGQLLQNLMNDPGEERITAGRFGGEEFVILFSGGNPVNHHKKTEEIRRQFSELQFSFMKEHITISGGIVTCVSKQDDLMKVLKVADDALYDSKHNGKNRITVGKI